MTFSEVLNERSGHVANRKHTKSQTPVSLGLTLCLSLSKMCLFSGQRSAGQPTRWLANMFKVKTNLRLPSMNSKGRFAFS